jgi:hypothetical protein
MSTAAPASPAKAAAAKNQLVPPDEQFWKRYSPHYEFPLSGVSSFALHLLVVGLATLLFMMPWIGREPEPMELDEVVWDGGGGGSPDGIGDGPGKGASGAAAVDEQKLPDQKTRFETETVKTPELPDKQAPVLTLPELSDPDLARLIEQNNQAVKSIKDLPKTTANAMREGLVAGKGKGGPGSGGGEGSGTGPGKGDGSGPGTGKISKSLKRMLRWTMAFNTRDGRDYAQQLRSLGAILAVEQADDPQKGMIYRELTPPAKGEIEDLNSLKRIWWIDDKAESVTALSQHLGIRPIPRRFIAFLPVELEEKLLRLELNYAGGKREEDIKETVFEVQRVGGKYEPRVVHQDIRK